MEFFILFCGFCVKQKINQKNTWELNLIDHLCEIIKVEDENNAETNFQKVSFRIQSSLAFVITLLRLSKCTKTNIEDENERLRYHV